MKSKVKKILLRILLVIGIIIAVVLIWLLCNYKYLTTLTISYDPWGENNVNYGSYVNSQSFGLLEDAEEVIFYLKGQVTKGEITVSLYSINEGGSVSYAMDDMENGPASYDGATLLCKYTYAEGDTFDVEESLGSQERGTQYVLWVDQTDDLEIQIWENIETYNYGRVHEKYKFMNKLRNWGLLHDRDEEE